MSRQYCTQGCNDWVGWVESCKTYLGLGDAKAGGQLCALGQREVLGPLEPSLQLLDLQRRVNRTWLPDLLPLSIDSCDQLAVFYYTVSCNIQELHFLSNFGFGEVLLVRDCAIENGELNMS